MDVNGINKAASYTAPTTTTTSTTSNTAENTNKAKEENTAGVIYEKSSDKAVAKKDNSAIVAKLKADLDARTKQLQSLVEKMMSKQGQTIGKADDMWKFLASGNFTVTAEEKAQAQADIAEDGYWGVEQTSDRIVDFAKALSGGDTQYADKLIAAFKKGYEQATGAWGKNLPDISKRTYDAVIEKMNDWKNGTEKQKEVISDTTGVE